jgi:hypothetical protein
MKANLLGVVGMRFFIAINYWFFSLAFVACGIIAQEQLRSGRWPNDRVEAWRWFFFIVDWYILALIVFWIQLAAWAFTRRKGLTSWYSHVDVRFGGCFSRPRLVCLMGVRFVVGAFSLTD